MRKTIFEHAEQANQKRPVPEKAVIIRPVATLLCLSIGRTQQKYKQSQNSLKAENSTKTREAMNE